MSSTRNRKHEKLADREYRQAYVDSQISIGVPFQIRALRRQRQWSQGKLAEESGMLQPRISAIEKAGKGKLNLDTLQRLAAAFDVALMIKFVPFSELVDWEDNFDPDGFTVCSFDEDSDLKQGRADEAELAVQTHVVRGISTGAWLLHRNVKEGSSQTAVMTSKRPPASEISVHAFVSNGVQYGR